MTYPAPSINVTLYRKRLFLVVSIVWLITFVLSAGKLQLAIDLVVDYGYFFLVGIVGAVVANSTGAGGGIIFIPFFSALGIHGTQAVGTSILIQCFGMTAGAVSWLTSSHIAKTNSFHLNHLIFQLLIICGGSAVVGILCGQYLFVAEDPALMILTFKIFSVVFGFVLLAIIFFSHRQIHTQFDLLNFDLYLLMLASFIGGLITAWISVGVGEIVAIVLILRRYPTMVAIALGVIVSSISVFTAAFQHIAVLASINWSVIQFAAPGAILGGTFAYLLSERLGPVRLKIFFALWIIITGLLMS